VGTEDTRLMRALRGRPTDGVPFWEVWFAMPGLARHIMGEPVEDLPTRVRFARRMGWEYLTVGVPSRHPGGGSGTASDGTTHYVQQGKAPLEELLARPDPDLSRAAEEVAEVVRVAHDEGMLAIAYVLWCFHSASITLGLEHLAYLAYDEPEYLHAYFDWFDEFSRRAIREVVIEQGVDVVLFDGDCAYKNGLMMRPDMFREFVFERTRQTVAPLREAGILYTLHSDGKADELLPMLIELGFSGFHGVEAQANDLGDIKRRFGREITLIGNMDVVFLTHASAPEVRAATERMLRVGMEGGRYIAACNTSPLDYIPYENYLAMVDVIHHFGA
jgi:uroporphyrinogen decarboxylase